MLKRGMLVTLVCLTVSVDVTAQEARARAELLDLIQREKFDTILPGAMRQGCPAILPRK